MASEESIRTAADCDECCPRPRHRAPSRRRQSGSERRRVGRRKPGPRDQPDPQGSSGDMEVFTRTAWTSASAPNQRHAWFELALLSGGLGAWSDPGDDHP